MSAVRPRDGEILAATATVCVYVPRPESLPELNRVSDAAEEALGKALAEAKKLLEAGLSERRVVIAG